MTLSPILTWEGVQERCKRWRKRVLCEEQEYRCLQLHRHMQTHMYTARYSGRLNLNRSRQVLPIHYAQHLLANVLGPAQRTSLDKVLIAPWVGELVVLPGVVHGQQGEVVPFGLVEFGLLLICKGLFILQAVGRSSFPTQATD